MILDTTTRKIQISLSAVATSANMPVVVDYVDSTATTFTPGVTPTTTNGTTLVDILAAPAASTQRKVNGITIHNLDTAAKTVLIYLNDNGTSYQLVDAILQVSDTLGYTDIKGWYVMDSSGAIKGVGPTGASGATGAAGVNGATGMPGLDGEDGQDGMPIPGPQGVVGVTGATGPQGPIGWGLPGEDGEDALHIPGPVGPAGAAGASGGNTTTTKLPTIGCTQGTGALTFTASSIYLDFRSTTLTSGTPSTVLAAPSSLVLPSGGTLGAVTTVSARIIVVEMNNAGTAELAIVNIAGGNDLSETGLISTTAIGAGSTANNVFYSTTSRTNLAYRVVGSVDAVNTAGAWGNPTLVQGAGGLSDVAVALHAAGSAPMFACRAWVNFNGTGTVAIRASGNVSSITDNGVGDYTVNFTTAMQDADYCVAGAISSVYDSGVTSRCTVPEPSLLNTGSVRIIATYDSNVKLDSALVCIQVFR